MYVKLKDINKTYAGYQASNHVSFGIEQGRLIALLGPSGSGKTTILRMIAGLETPDSGTIDGLKNLKISAVFQEDRLLEGYDVLTNLRFVCRQRLSDAELSAYAATLLPQNALSQPVCEFSGGMKRRVAILRAILAPTDIILMDEPFTGLDADTRQLTIDLVKELCAGKLLIIATHAEDDAELLGAKIIHL